MTSTMSPRKAFTPKKGKGHGIGNTRLLVLKPCFGTLTFGDGRGLFEGISAVGQAGADELVARSDFGLQSRALEIRQR
jgi:hypothetical protein